MAEKKKMHWTDPLNPFKTVPAILNVAKNELKIKKNKNKNKNKTNTPNPKQDEINKLNEQIKAGTDQTIINYLVQQNKVDIKYMSEAYNLQDLFRKNLLHIPGHSWWEDNLDNSLVDSDGNKLMYTIGTGILPYYFIKAIQELNQKIGEQIKKRGSSTHKLLN